MCGSHWGCVGRIWAGADWQRRFMGWPGWPQPSQTPGRKILIYHVQAFIGCSHPQPAGFLKHSLGVATTKWIFLKVTDSLKKSPTTLQSSFITYGICHKKIHFAQLSFPLLDLTGALYTTVCQYRSGQSLRITSIASMQLRPIPKSTTKSMPPILRNVTCT